jgi:hypothetical protein
LTEPPHAVDNSQPELPDAGPIDKPADWLQKDFVGKTFKVRYIFETHSRAGRFIERNYNALLRA